jgi:geranylgeranyl pyrophosphate synthase
MHNICDLLKESRLIARNTLLDELAPNSELHRAVIYHLSESGSEARAAICLSAGMALGLETNAAVRLAAAVETLHNASLIQDDLQDQDEFRRNRPTIWKIFGRDMAINATDLFLANAFQLVVSARADSALELVTAMNRAIANTLQGQTKDLNIDHKLCIDEAIAIAKEKSGPFFSLSLQLPLILGGQSKFLSIASEAGASFGVGYQIFDDLHDRKLDRKCKSMSNMALLIEDNVDSDVSVPQNTAEDLAYQFLNHAASKADALPNECGKLLVNKCFELLRLLDREAA